MKDIGSDIADLRQRRGWTQAELARHIDVDRRIIGSIETGQYPASARLLMAIEKALDVPKGTLLVWVVRRELQKLSKKVEMSVQEICTMACDL